MNKQIQRPKTAGLTGEKDGYDSRSGELADFLKDPSLLPRTPVPFPGTRRER